PVRENLSRLQLEEERRALLAVRLDPDPAVHAFDELLADVEPEPGPSHAAHHLRVGAVELLEDPILVLGIDPEPLVANGEAHGALGFRGLDLDMATLGRVLDRVPDQVDEPPPCLAAVRRPP